MSFIKKNAKVIAIALAAAIVIVGGVFIFAWKMQPNDEQMAALPEGITPLSLTVIAEKDTVAGIETDSGFIIQSVEPIRVSTLKSQLSIVPAVEYKLEQRTDKELYIKTVASLEGDTVYNVLIAQNAYEPPLSWAFQTKNNFRVTSTFPARDGRSVPVNSGIELHFSQPVADISKSVTFSPELPGRFSQLTDKIVVFIPTEGMEYNTSYTVTLAADTGSQVGDTLAEEYSFSFRTERLSDNNYHNALRAYDGLSETFTSADPIFIKLSANSEFENKEVQVAIYRYSGLDAYMAALKSSKQGEIDYLPTNGLTKMAEYTDNLLMNTDLYWSTAFLPLQENPGLGWYLVDIHTPAGNASTDNQHTQKLLQITDIAVYSQTANNQMLLWLNDAASGQPLAGADISAEGQSTRSDQNGLALLNIPVDEEREEYYDYYYGYYQYSAKEVRIQQGQQMYGEYLSFYGENEMPLYEKYYTYVYTDREAYQPDDTVHFWGMVLPRVSNAERPKHILLDWQDGGKYPDGIELEVRADGSFQGEIKLENHVSGWEYMEFTLDGKTLLSTSISVLQYVKPVYTADITVDKPYYRKHDTINVVATANFYDGTPAKDLDFKVSYDYGEDKQLRTDENGRAQASFSPHSGFSWHPRYESLYGRTTGAEDQTIYCYQSALVFPSDYMLQSSTAVVDGGFTLDIESYAIDFSRVDSGEYADSGNDYDTLRGRRADMKGEGQLYRVEYVKRKTGEYYDFVNKTVVERFTYDRMEAVIETFPIQTENGRFTSQPFYYPKEDNISYYFNLNYTCPDGSTLVEKRYVHGYQDYYDNYEDRQFKRYYFRQDEADSANYNDDYYYYGNYYSNSYGLLDTINMRLSDQNDQTPQQGRVLYTVLGKDLFSYSTVSGSHFSLDFKPEYVPNAVVVGAYFDGQHIFSVSQSYINYRYDDNNLNISVTADKERYRPGEEVTLKLRITNEQGQGKATNYLLSVADEAAFAIEDQDEDPLWDIYSTYYIEFQQYASYIQPYEIDYGAECGEGGSDSVRRDFVDTVAFLSGQTNAAGEATLTFKLADNITSWRLTSIAFYETNVDGSNIPYVGTDVRNIESGLPFFINQVLNERYLVGDSVGLSLRGAGTDISSKDTVNYELTLTGGDTKIEKTAQGAAGNFCLLDFGTLPAGTYKVLIRARCGSYSDALEKEIEVVDSLLLTSRHTSGDLSGGLNIDAKRFPVSIVLYDVDNTLYYNILYQMLHAYGQRADQIIARALAGKRLNEISEDSHFDEILALDGNETYNWRYGVRLFPYAEADSLLTAKAAAAAPEFLNQIPLADYFIRLIQDENSTPLDIAAAYMGLGALKKPVLLDLRALFAEAKASEDFTLEEKIYLATGLALLGDTADVRGWYEDELHGQLTQEGNTLFYNQGVGAHEDYQLTAAAAALACLVNSPDHQQLLLYLTTHRSATYLPLLELATYVGKYSPKPNSAAAFSYQLAGKTIKQTFDKRRQLYLELGETQLAEANFTVLEGNVGYNAYYFGGFEEAEKTLPEGVSISQSLSSASVKLGNVVTVSTTLTFSEDAPVGYYQISQIVPTGLRFTRVTNYSYYQNDWYYRTGESGMLDVYINPLRGYRNSDDFNRPTMPASVTFTYEARAVLPGNYIVEAPAISYSGSNTLYAGERHSISVEK